MSYFSDMDGLDLFTAPFGSPQPVKPKAPASRPQQPKTKASQQAKAAAPLPKTVPQTIKTKASETQPQPVKANPPMEQPRQTNLPKNPVPDKKAPVLQKEQAKAAEPKPKPEKNAPAPAKAAEPKLGQKPQAEVTVKAQPEPPKKELAMDMTDHSIPAGKPLDASEDEKRKAHEEAEAKRKADWEEKQAAKKQAKEAALKAIKSMSDAEVVSASTERVRTDVERLTRRNMKECVSEHLQNLCRQDPVFAQQIMLPHKSMINCFRYINRKAKDFIQQEMKDNDIHPENGVYSSDVPDDCVYQWAEDYFNDPDAEGDKEKEEKFVPRPYVGSSASKPKKTSKKTAAKKEPKKQEPKDAYEQMSFTEVL